MKFNSLQKVIIISLGYILLISLSIVISLSCKPTKPARYSPIINDVYYASGFSKSSYHWFYYDLNGDNDSIYCSYVIIQKPNRFNGLRFDCLFAQYNDIGKKKLICCGKIYLINKK